MNAGSFVKSRGAMACAVVIGSVGACGCGGDATSTQMTAPSTSPAATFSQIYAMAFPSMTAPRCEFCHSMPPSDVGNGKLHLGTDQQTAYAALVGQTSMSARCGGHPLVVPNQPEMSLLYLKLSPNPPCGSRMPLGGTPFTDAQLEMVRSWIAAGAPND
ncbi:MAG TPA: hypothetical protein VHC69_06160 [Polyangiaceae bacterium]|nr:hypothetical protein [Polyangiaceae bacterium]